jgi:cation transport protein ChaC
MTLADDSNRRAMRLTDELVRRVHRDLPDRGLPAHLKRLSDSDYDADLTEFLAARPDGPVHVFCYGSLIWKPIFEPAATARGHAPGWSRAFTLRLTSFRGTPEIPGLMMQIDRGDGCDGVLQEVAASREWVDLSALWRREMSTRPSTNLPAWIDVDRGGTMIKAIAFTANRESPNYVGGLDREEVARVLARACGHWGSGADYLRQTVLSLEDAGIHDPYLWDLQDRVAEVIESQGPP